MFQFPLGMYGQLYAMCAFIGCVFVFGSAILGMVDDSGDGGVEVDGDTMGGDTGGGIDLDGDGIPDIGGDDMGAAPGSSSTHVIPASFARAAMQNVGSGFGRFALALLSPMAVAMFVGFFGLGGLLAAHLWPWLGPFTLLVAFGTAFSGTGILKLFIKWMFRRMHSSSSAGNSDIIGQTAEVNIPIDKDRPGEVIFVVHSKRYNSPARLLKANTELGKGEKVVIVDVQDHLVLVEPCDL